MDDTLIGKDGSRIPRNGSKTVVEESCDKGMRK